MDLSGAKDRSEAEVTRTRTTRRTGRNEENDDEEDDGFFRP
jgi:hypothetical protein